MIKYLFILGITLISFCSNAEGLTTDDSFQSKSDPHLRIEPPHWWVGMPEPNLEILIHGPEIGLNELELTKSGKGVRLTTTESLKNSNYLLAVLEISSEASPQVLKFRSKGVAGKFKFEYELKERTDVARGLDGSDFIYLITPDRFANGDPGNDSVEGMKQTNVDRTEPYQRHGGDIQGMIDHLEYIRDLGVTAIWPNPLQVNDQPDQSYHGYAITDNYRIDPRFGSNQKFRELKQKMNEMGMKMIMDVIYNHIGNEHHLYADLPDSSWFHFHPEFNQTNYRAPALMDPYASDYDKSKMTDGWFDKHMPDLNQKNPTVARYLIQETIWWVEEFGIEALRIDTYAYPDQDFMRAWGKAMKEAFPDLFLFAETWVHGIPVQAWFLGDALGPEPNYLDGLTDFQVHYALNDGLTQNQGWTGGIARLYYTLAKDYVYDHPDKLVTFLDNHDLARFYGVVGEDFEKFKMGVGMLMTLRGIPSLYYGTEILMKETDGHGKIREDFPGGWEADSLNKFTPQDRSDLENEAVEYISSLAKFRKDHTAVHSGKTTQYVPVDGVYAYFRWNEEETVMVLVNTSDEKRESPAEKYDQFLSGKTELKSVPEGKTMALPENFELDPKSIGIYLVR